MLRLIQEWVGLNGIKVMNVTGIIYLCSLGVLGFGYIYDFWTLNDQITVINGSD